MLEGSVEVEDLRAKLRSVIQQGVSEGSIARQSRVSQATVSRLLNGTFRDLRYSAGVRISQALDEMTRERAAETDRLTALMSPRITSVKVDWTLERSFRVLAALGYSNAPVERSRGRYIAVVSRDEISALYDSGRFSKAARIREALPVLAKHGEPHRLRWDEPISEARRKLPTNWLVCLVEKRRRVIGIVVPWDFEHSVRWGS